MKQLLSCIAFYLLTYSTSSAEDLIHLLAGADPWPPYIDESHSKGGVSVEIADAALRTQGYTVTNKILPWARAIEETKQGRLDLILDAWLNEERTKFFKFSKPYINGPIKFIKRKGHPFSFEGLPSLQGRSIALVRNYAYGDDFLNSTHFEKLYAHDFLQSMQMLALGRVELAIENELVALTRIAQGAPELLHKIEIVDRPLSDAKVYVVSGLEHPDHERIIQAFNRGLDIILENGTYRQILERNSLPVPLFLTN